MGGGHALVTPWLTTALLVGIFPLSFAYIGGEHKDYRYRKGSGGTLSPRVDAVTSNVPFVALVMGRQSWSALADELKWSNAAIGVGVATLLAIRRGRLPPAQM